jgi:hypothetical protein
MMLDISVAVYREDTTFILQHVPIKPMRVGSWFWFLQIHFSKTSIGQFSEIPVIA